MSVSSDVACSNDGDCDANDSGNGVSIMLFCNGNDSRGVYSYVGSDSGNGVSIMLFSKGNDSRGVNSYVICSSGGTADILDGGSVCVSSCVACSSGGMGDILDDGSSCVSSASHVACSNGGMSDGSEDVCFENGKALIVVDEVAVFVMSLNRGL